MLTQQVRTLAVIKEADCIGCGKCIKACPVDAILGSVGKMHTVIASECIGCKLCLPPCPVDCIILHTEQTPKLTALEKADYSTKIKKRYQARKQRLQKEQDLLRSQSTEDKQNYINQLIARITNAKN